MSINEKNICRGSITDGKFKIIVEVGSKILQNYAEGQKLEVTGDIENGTIN